MAEGFGMSGWGGSIESGGGGGGEGSPFVTNFEPVEGTPIERGEALKFDLIFSTSLAAVTIYVLYRETGASEVVYDSQNGFAANFKTYGSFLGSERQDIENGWHVIVRRRAGWPASPSIVVEGADESGLSITEGP